MLILQHFLALKISGTTECEPLHGWGFRRGGYQCRCRPGFRLPNVVRRPYLGEIVERASPAQYGKRGNFDCKPIGFIQKLPVEKVTIFLFKRSRNCMQRNIIFFIPNLTMHISKFSINLLGKTLKNK